MDLTSCGVVSLALILPLQSEPADERARILERWERLPTCQLIIHSEPHAKVVELDDDPFERSNWRDPDYYTPDPMERELRLRIRGEEFAVKMGQPGSGLDSMWISYTGGQLVSIQQLGTEQPTGFIRTTRNATRLSTDPFLTVFEQQLFSICIPWSEIVEHYDGRITGVETIDGHECVKVENQTYRDSARFVLWLARDLDYAPVKVDFQPLGPDGTMQEAHAMRVLNHVAIGNTWVAGEAIVTVRSPKDYQISAYEVTDAQVGEEYAPENFYAAIPAGTHIQDLVREETWYADGGGGRRQVHKMDMEKRARMAKAFEASIQRTEMKRSRNYGIAGVALIAAAVVGAVVLVKRRQAS